MRVRDSLVALLASVAVTVMALDAATRQKCQKLVDQIPPCAETCFAKNNQCRDQYDFACLCQRNVQVTMGQKVGQCVCEGVKRSVPPLWRAMVPCPSDGGDNLVNNRLARRAGVGKRGDGRLEERASGDCSAADGQKTQQLAKQICPCAGYDYFGPQ